MLQTMICNFGELELDVRCQLALNGVIGGPVWRKEADDKAIMVASGGQGRIIPGPHTFGRTVQVAVTA